LAKNARRRRLLRNGYDRIDVGRVWLMINTIFQPLKPGVQAALKKLLKPGGASRDQGGRVACHNRAGRPPPLVPMDRRSACPTLSENGHLYPSLEHDFPPIFTLTC
jgi:hypothetical protein